MKEKGNEKERIAIYGGAFDPPHNGHLACIALLLNSGRIDRVIVAPSGDRPDKPGATPARHRLAMTQEAVAAAFVADPRVSMEPAQATGVVGFGTIDLVEHLRAAHPDAELLVVIGPELVSDLPKWKAAERLQTQAAFLVIPRPGVSNAAPSSPWRGEALEAPYKGGVEISSTTVRELLARGKSCAGLVLPVVAAYAEKHGLYR